MRDLRIFVFLLFVSGVLAPCQSKPAPPSPQTGQPPDDLANALVQAAKASRVPLIAELAWPLPKVHLPEGSSADKQTLDALLNLAPGYEWNMEGRVLHFYSKKIRIARFNFLNSKFPQFKIPPNLSEFKLTFPTEATGLLEGYTAGAAITGFGDAQFEQQSLAKVTLANATALEVLLHVANEAPTFYTVIVFPSLSPSKKDAEERVVWQWGSLNEKPQPIYTQPPAKH